MIIIISSSSHSSSSSIFVLILLLVFLISLNQSEFINFVAFFMKLIYAASVINSYEWVQFPGLCHLWISDLMTQHTEAAQS